MKNYVLLLGAFVLSFGGISSANAGAVETVDKVDLVRYVGKWYEVASIPQSFAKQCVGETTAEYTALNDGKIKVVNSCATEKGDRSVAVGRAKVVDKDTNAKLKVTFVKIIDWVFAFGGDYWVVDLEQNYNYAVVGHPTRKYGWILSRQPSLAVQDLEAISERLKSMGYDTCQFLTTPQVGGFVEKKPLCEVVR